MPVLREGQRSLSSQPKPISLTGPLYDSASVDDAGAALIDVDHPLRHIAFRMVNSWRVRHRVPLDTFQGNLRKKVGRRGIVARRLKRLPSIVNKLNRIRRIPLSKMQDIAGCRVVVDTPANAFALAERFSASRIRHELVKADDYVTRPRATGYRSLHLIYSYFSDRRVLANGLKIEIQFRSQLQHQWATAVETVGKFINHDLKSGTGPPEWLRFFHIDE